MKVRALYLQRKHKRAAVRANDERTHVKKEETGHSSRLILLHKLALPLRTRQAKNKTKNIYETIFADIASQRIFHIKK